MPGLLSEWSIEKPVELGFVLVILKYLNFTAMNQRRRRELGIIEKTIEAIEAEINSQAELEEEAFENLPESIQYSEKGQQMENNKDELYDIASELEDLRERINDIIDN